MKNFSTQCVTLMMIIVMVCAAPTHSPCKDKRLYLEQIKDKAKIALKHSPPNLYVYKLSGYQKKCMEKFFCLAGESLKNATNSTSNEHLKTLEHALNAYNKFQNETCHLVERDLYSVKAFLEDIVFCVDIALNNKRSICHK